MRWSVEIASPPGVHIGGMLTAELTAIGAVVEVAVEEGELVAGSGTGSSDGRIGGRWLVEATSADEAAAAAAKLLQRTLDGLVDDEQIGPEDAIVDVLRVARYTGADDDFV